MKTIVLTGGGSAGHVTPNLALIPFLKDDYNIEYIGSFNGIEKELITNENIKYYGISSGKLRRYIDMQNVKDIKNVISGYFEAKKILKKIKPALVFSKGGFVSVPVVLAAKKLKIPVIIHDSDYTVGLANKIAIPFAKYVCTSFKETATTIKNAIWTGSPIRESIFNGNKEAAYKICNFKNDKPTLLFMGGSLGASKINEVLIESLDELLMKYNVIHICGKNKVDTSINKLNYKAFEYIDKELNDIFAASKLIISRAGSNSIFEFAALNIPSLLIPLPKSQSRGDQILNAVSFKKQGFSEVLNEEDLTSQKLIETINTMYDNKYTYINNMEKADKINGTSKIIELINKTIKNSK